MSAQAGGTAVRVPRAGRSRRAVRRALAAALLLGACGAQAFAYRLIQPPRRWFPQDLPRIVYVDPRGRASVNDPDKGVTATLLRIEGWETPGGVGNLIRPIKGTASDPNAVPGYAGGDGISVMRFDDPAGICGGSCLAATTTGFINLFDTGDCNGGSWYRWTDSDIVFNPNYSYTSEPETDAEGGCSGEYYIEQISLHEIGHLLGLGHSEFTSAVMYGGAGTCQRNKTRIQPDDADGIKVPYACAFSKSGVYADSDGDGARQDTDCDDQDATVYPGAPEICDGKDNDCDNLGDAAEGLVCSEACLNASAGKDGLLVTRGGCPGEPLPIVRLVYSRGDLDAMHASGGVTSVEIVACPSYSIYDRVGESSAPGGGSGQYYLVRGNTDANYGSASNGTPRTPTEQGCP